MCDEPQGRKGIEMTESNNKKGAFKLFVMTDIMETDTGQTFNVDPHYLIRDIRHTDGGDVFFYSYYHDNKTSLDGSHLPLKHQNESMLDYFDRIALEQGGFWVENVFANPVAIKIYGKFSYQDDGSDDFANKYEHAIKKSKETTEKVVTLASRRDKDKE